MGRPYAAATEEGRPLRSQDNLMVRYGRYRRSILDMAKKGLQHSEEPPPEEFALLTSTRDFSHLLTTSEFLELK
uniref:Uncharacterized protein n=2 Tax=Tetraselmis sp. GSL018 TaxID=582737 RepID=A0A061S990_9CHLO